MVQNLFKKGKILYCGTTRFSNVELGAIRQYQNTKTVSKKKNMGENHIKNLSKFQKSQLSNFILTSSNEEKVNSVWPDMAYSKELEQKMKMPDNIILPLHLS